MDKKLINKEMTIQEIFSDFPDKAQKLAQEMTSTGLHCVGCQAAVWETLEGGMRGHGYSDEEIEQLVRRLNEILAHEVDASSIQLTKRAAEKFQKILKEEGKEDWHLRFGCKVAGCSGFEYALDYSKAAGEEDEVFTSYGVEIHVTKEMLGKLMGSEIDYVEGLNNSGFKIINPNVKKACNCGNSHSY